LQVAGTGRFSGQTFGSYRLGDIIGRGGMGDVYEAFHTESGDIVAVKLIKPGALASPDIARRFLREVKVARSLESAHIVRVLEVGDEHAPLPYLAMERLRGQDLAQLLRQEGRLSIPRVCHLLREVGAGMKVAWSAGIVHRDLKPHNLFLADTEPGGQVWKVLDFGVSKLADQSGTLTRDNVVGTPAYMAPEQAEGDDVDHRADLYAVAAIAYRCLTGHLPFIAKDIPTTLFEVVYRMPRQPSDLAVLPSDVDLVLAIGMAKSPADRFDSVAELEQALAAAHSGDLSDELRRRGTELLRSLPWQTS
jgi:serine/threonine-protein kinase